MMVKWLIYNFFICNKFLSFVLRPRQKFNSKTNKPSHLVKKTFPLGYFSFKYGQKQIPAAVKG